ncbi:MAG TPA: DUF3237 domain-containing protein [Thiolinea sp.]|nr:DUF3237 domain-containing protein [Thiolinea sp.]
MSQSMTPVIPTLEHLMRVEVEIAAPLMVGPVPTGERRIIPITGGRFEGEKLRGEVVPGGADWQLVQAGGSAILEARYTLRTDDDALIFIINRGFRTGRPEVLARIMAGEPVEPSEYYFRAAPVFETGAESYQWLNYTVAVCSAVRTLDMVLLDFYQVS